MNTHRVVAFPVLHASALILLTMSLTACGDGHAGFIDQFADTFGETVTVGRSDHTPPSVYLQVPDLGDGPAEVGPGDPPLVIELDEYEEFFLVAVAEDSEGVQSVGFSGSSKRSCTSSDGVGSVTFATLLGPESTDDATVGESALTRRWIPTYITPDYGLCPAGQSGSYSITHIARGRNFSGQEMTSSAVTVVYQYPGT